MRSTFSLLLYINRNKVRADGTTAILCRISIDGKSTTITTSITCNPKQWNAKKAETSDMRTNNRLKEFRKHVERIYDDMLKEQGVVSTELLKNKIAGHVIVPTRLLQMGERERERLAVRAKEIGSNSTYRSSRYYQSYIREFLESKGMSDIAFSDITEEFGREYKVYLKRYKNFGASQTNLCLCWLNRLVYLAVDHEIIRANPLEEVEYEKKPPAKRMHISKAELKQLLELKLPDNDPLKELARRTFIFSCFTGLAYVDTQLLYPHHIGKTAERRLYIRINRRKTKVESFIPLHPIAEQIINLYNTKDDTQPVFPLPSRDMMWFEIHELGVIIGRKENLSYHQARHRFGSFLISEGICTESIAKMMGHASITSTQTYAKISEKKISEDMDRLMERRKNNKY